MTTSNRILRVVTSIGCLLVVAVATMGLPVARLFLATALFSAFLLYLLNHPRLRDFPAILLLGAAAARLHLWVWAGAVTLTPALAGAGLGLGTLAFLLIRLCWAEGGAERQDLLAVLTPSTFLTVLLFCTHNLLNLTGVLHPKTLDLYALSFDGSLGISPSFWMGQRFESVHWFGFVGTESYFALLPAMAVAHILHAKWRPARISRFFMLELFFYAGFLGYLIYQAFPVAGPVYAYPGLFPQHVLTYQQAKHLFVEPLPLATNIVRNGMPSLHMSWALAVWWNLRKFNKPVAWAGFIFAMLTVIATLGTGEHYLADLVVSVPFTACIQAIVSRHLSLSRRLRPMLVCALLTGTWLVLLRYCLPVFWVSPVIPWTAILVTVGISLRLVLPLTSFEGIAESAPAASIASVATA